jgi:hypothetical protein
MSRIASNTRTSRLRRAFAVIAAFIAATIVLFGGTAVVPQASPVLAPVQAHATAGDTSVQVRAGGAVRAYCDWNVAWYYVLQNGDSSYNKCTADNHDTDGLMSPGSKRCIMVIGIGAAIKGRQGLYYINQGVKYKIPDMTDVVVGRYVSGACPRKYVSTS